MEEKKIIEKEEKLFIETNGVCSSLTVGKLASALSKAQGEFEHAKKDSDNPFFKSKYADLAEVINVCREKLSKNGIAVLQHAQGDNVQVRVTTRLMHESGEWIESTVCGKPTKGDIQGQGSALTYLRRYSLSSMLNIAQDDDDGNSCSGLSSVKAVDKEACNELKEVVSKKPSIKAQIEKRYGSLHKVPSDKY